MVLSLIGIGGNLPAPGHDRVETGLEAAIAALDHAPLAVVGRSRWLRTAPVPSSDQPWFLNAVVAVRSELGPAELMAHLLAIERRFGRVRGLANAARSLDLDLLDHGGLIAPAPADPELPHPRLTQRGFVLMPLAEVAPEWRHPVDGRDLAALIAALPDEQRPPKPAGD